MKTSVVALALFAAAVSAQDFQINTPNPPTQCVPVQITWSNGQPPFFLVSFACDASVKTPNETGHCSSNFSIKPGGQPTAAALQQYTGLTGNSFTWSSNITAGTSVGFTLTDAQGNVAQSAAVTIQDGPDSSCLNGGSASSTTVAGGTTSGTDTGATTSTAPAASTTSTGAATTGASSTTGASTGASTGGSSRSSTGTASGSSSSASATGGSGNNGAMSNAASVGLVGVLGAVAAALLA
ncbi:hypothetical protein BD413DRAFT_296530 [Trametes elegans]|nr:hypothetical protein BD413DRAFT_296530 [Trametes elegans]